ncbi:MAG: hypothetical protein NTU83_12865, partial [Candidatus Hydrogenedentes bacterium]|nr:hypothetical protein [Candidatus Hydrogenedentota bacterium]
EVGMATPPNPNAKATIVVIARIFFIYVPPFPDRVFTVADERISAHSHTRITYATTNLVVNKP